MGADHGYSRVYSGWLETLIRINFTYVLWISGVWQHQLAGYYLRWVLDVGMFCFANRWPAVYSFRL